MIRIELKNAKCRLLGNPLVIDKVIKAFRVKHPGAFHIMRSGAANNNWDGHINYVTDAGYFKTGLITQIYNYIKDKLNEEVEIFDFREKFDISKPIIPKKVGNLTPRDYQIEGLKAVVNNKVGNVLVPICTINAATNAGKTNFMAMIYLAYQRKIPALVLINDGDLFNQFKNEIPELVGDDFGYVRGKEKNWNKFTVAMVQTLSANLASYKNQLSKYGIVLVDEADLGDNKTYKGILQQCDNACVKVGLSGTIYLSKLKKDFVKNQNLHSFFGEEVFKITKSEMRDKGHSAEVIVTMLPGSNKLGLGDFRKEYEQGIIYNEERLALAIDRMKLHIKLKRLPALVVCQFHEHINLTYLMYSKEFGSKYKVAYVHGDVKERKKILEDFRDGKIDILIASFIVKRGKNFPLIKYIQNLAGSDSQETIWQIMGRGERKHESKTRTFMDDFYDKGRYLERHSKHRIRYYKQTGFKVKLKI